MSDENVTPGKREWRSFWSLIGMQSTNAFNDNFAKFILMPLGVALVAQGDAFEGVQYVLGLLLVIPFVLLAPTAGWLGDRFSKNVVIRWSSWFQLFALLVMIGGLWFGAKWGGDHGGWALAAVMVAFLLLAIQSALLSPAKMGVVKELVGSERLGFANGVMEGSVVFAILAGQVVGAVWFDDWGVQKGLGLWNAALVPVSWLLIGAVLSIVLSRAIQRTEPKRSEKFSWDVATQHFRDLAKIRDDRGMWLCSLAIAFFWAFGGFLQFLLLQRAEERVGSFAGMGSETALLWLPVVVGIVLGSGLASWICRRRNELGLVVIGGFLMTLAMFLLGVVPWSEFWVRVLLAVTGTGAALFLVPLNTFLQDRAKDSERSLVLSASNLCINLGGVVAIGFQFLLKFLGAPIWLQFLIASVICGLVTLSVLRLLPKDFVRLVFLGMFRSVYKIRTLGVENVPREGGVLMVPNHLTYIDAFVLSAACPRPIRFVLFADCFESKWVGGFARFFDAVAISPTTAREGIRLAAQALKEGTVVCVFAEGQLSRTGGLSEIKRGYQMMAKRGGADILPAYMDGLWGSMWSFSEGNFLGKRPRSMRYGVTVAFGETLPWNGELPGVLRELSVETAADREIGFLAKRNREPQIVGDLPRGWSEMMEQCWSETEAGREMRVNALQLSQVHLADRTTRLLVEWTEGDELSGILGILWPLSVGARVSLADGLSDAGILAKVAREGVNAVALRTVKGREDLVQRLQNKDVIVWSFDEVGLSDGQFFGCLVKGERVVSFSRPDPDYPTTTELPQSGWRKGKRGRLLPGWPESQFGPLDEEGFLLTVPE